MSKREIRPETFISKQCDTCQKRVVLANNEKWKSSCIDCYFKNKHKIKMAQLCDLSWMD